MTKSFGCALVIRIVHKYLNETDIKTIWEQVLEKNPDYEPHPDYERPKDLSPLRDWVENLFKTVFHADVSDNLIQSDDDEISFIWSDIRFKYAETMCCGEVVKMENIIKSSEGTNICKDCWT